MSQDAAGWQEAAGLRGRFSGWVVIWLDSEGEFRAYRGVKTLRAPASKDMESMIPQQRRPGYPGGPCERGIS